MSYIYVCDPGSALHHQEGQLQITCNKNLVRTLPIELLEGLVVCTNAAITSACCKELLERGIPVNFLSSSGSYFGRLESTKHVNIARQRMQFRKGDDAAFCLRIAKSIVKSKINNQAVILRRYQRNKEVPQTDDQIKTLKIFTNKTEACENHQQLIGYEGMASREYFKALSLLVDKTFAFSGRSRMPPKDPFNSLLSFGYTLLMYEIYTAVVSKGLNPHAGLMHQDHIGHPALASDLMEEWRPVVVDALVMSMVNGHELERQEFTTDPETGAVFLGKENLKRFIRGFEKKLSAEASYIESLQGKSSFRRGILFQAGSLAKALEEDDPLLYRPVWLR